MSESSKLSLLPENKLTSPPHLNLCTTHINTSINCIDQTAKDYFMTFLPLDATAAQAVYELVLMHMLLLMYAYIVSIANSSTTMTCLLSFQHCHLLDYKHVTS